MGCFCWMPMAVWVKSKDCWLYEKFGDQYAGNGWEKRLNGSEIYADEEK